MSKLIESVVAGSIGDGGRIVDDVWTEVDTVGGLDCTEDAAAVLVPLSLWSSERDRLIALGMPVGVRLEPHDDPASLVEDLGRLSLIAVHFPKFTDGRGYSIARLLRERYGYRGPLRAVGEVLRDQLFYLLRCGFDSFAMRHQEQVAGALSAYRDFSDAYQTAVDRKVPLFARRAPPPCRRAGRLSHELAAKADAARAVLVRVARDHAPTIFTTSFGAEDMVVFDLIAGSDAAKEPALRSIGIATLDTGRLPDETYQVWQAATARYRRKVDALFPAAAAVEQYVRINGINAFYESVAQRKECCHIRKVEPLARALAGKGAWITGLRRSQAASRSDLAVEAHDVERDLLKISPLADWSEQDVWDYLRALDVPVNALHARGYPSIGCAPCTRAVAPGEDLRAGRWWWENADAKECGLHVPAEDDPVVEAHPG